MKSNNILYKTEDGICVDGLETEYTSLTENVSSDAGILKNEEEKIKIIAGHFKSIMQTLGLDLKDDSLRETPERVAKMYVKEIFSGLDPNNKPKVSLFENKYRYNKMVLEKDISLYTFCEHHFLPILGKVHVAYISKGKVIGLSKLNRLVQFYASRPQVQERLTVQISESIKKAIRTEDVAVLIDAVHLCVASRGIKDTNSSTITSDYSGKFINEEIKNEFLSLIK